MRCFFILAILLFAGCQCPTDLEPIYYVEISEARSLIEVKFSQDLYECINGTAHRGFAFRSVEVENPMLNKSPLRGEYVQEPGGYSYYRYLPDVQPAFAHYAVTFSINGREYETDYAKAEVMQGVIRIHTKIRSAKNN